MGAEHKQPRLQWPLDDGPVQWQVDLIIVVAGFEGASQEQPSAGVADRSEGLTALKCLWNEVTLMPAEAAKSGMTTGSLWFAASQSAAVLSC